MLNHDWSVRLMTSVLLLFFFLCAKVLLRDSRFCSDSLIKLPGLEEFSSRCGKLLLSQEPLGPRSSPFLRRELGDYRELAKVTFPFVLIELPRLELISCYGFQGIVSDRA